MTNTDAKLLIDLDAPQDGIIPAELRNIHKDELERVAGWVTERAKEAREHYAPQGRRSEAPGRHSQTAAARRGILIDGGRGVGKTSFLRALQAHFNEAKRDSKGPHVHVLPLLDPTLIDGDRVFIATVVANVLDAVERCQGRREPCGPDRRRIEELDRSVNELHAGLLASSDATWEALTRHGAGGAGFSDQLLRLAKGGIHLADRFESFAHAAAEALGVDMLVQPLDDVDMAGQEAWTALEAVRRYLTGPSLLPVVAGHLPQFVSVIFGQRLTEAKEELKALKEMDAVKETGGTRYRQRVDQLDEVSVQHVNKLFDPSKRQQLRANRERLLREANLVRTGGPETGEPLLLGGKALSGPVPAAGCFLGRAELALFPSNSEFVRGHVLDLLPENTREFMQALRLFDRIVGHGNDKPSAARRHDIVQLIELLRSTVPSSAGVSATKLLAIIDDGITPDLAGMLSDIWDSLVEAPSVSTSRRPRVMARLVDLALTGRTASDLGQVMKLFCFDAPIFDALPMVHAEEAYKGAMETRQSIKWVAFAHFNRKPLYGERPARIFAGSPEPRADGPALQLYRRMAMQRRHDTNELVPFWQLNDSATVVDRSYVRFADLYTNEIVDVQVVLHLYIVPLVDSTQTLGNWFIYPAAGLNAALLFFEQYGLVHAERAQQAQNVALADVAQLMLDSIVRGWARPWVLPGVPTATTVMSRGPTWVEGRESLTVAENLAPSPELAAAMDGWVTDHAGSDFTTALSASEVFSAWEWWRESIQQVGENSDGRLMTVGGYLERCMLLLIQWLIGRELDPVAAQQWRVSVPLNLLDARVGFYAPIVIADGASWREARQPHGPLADFLTTLRGSDGGQIRGAIPFATFMASCPLVRLVIGPEWGKLIDGAFPMHQALADYVAKDKGKVHAMLSGLPLAEDETRYLSPLAAKELDGLRPLPLSDVEQMALAIKKAPPPIFVAP